MFSPFSLNKHYQTRCLLHNITNKQGSLGYGYKKKNIPPKPHSKNKQTYPVLLVNSRRLFVYFFMVQNCLIMCNQTLYNSMRYFTPENMMMVGNQALISTLAVGIYVVKWCDVKCRSCSAFSWQIQT